MTWKQLGLTIYQSVGTIQFELLTYIINLSFEPSEVPQDIQISSMMAWYKKKGSKIFPSEIENHLWFRRVVCKLVLTDRKKFVQLDNTKSQEILICCGVPSSFHFWPYPVWIIYELPNPLHQSIWANSICWWYQPVCQTQKIEYDF